MSNDKIAIAAGLLLLVSAHKALRGSNVQAMQTKITGVSTPANVAANGYDQTPPAQVPSKPGPLPIALAASGLPTVNPLVDLTPNEVIRGGQYSTLIKNTGQSYDFRGASQWERDARASLTQYPTSSLINARMEESIKQAKELYQIDPATGDGLIVPL